MFELLTEKVHDESRQGEAFAPGLAEGIFREKVLY